jgi:hypothetical protein
VSVRELLNSARLQAALTIFWLAMIPVSLATGWVKSVTYVSALSLWALVASHGAWWAASRAAEEDVVEQLVEQTELDRAE